MCPPLRLISVWGVVEQSVAVVNMIYHVKTAQKFSIRISNRITSEVAMTLAVATLALVKWPLLEAMCWAVLSSCWHRIGARDIEQSNIARKGYLARHTTCLIEISISFTKLCIYAIWFILNFQQTKIATNLVQNYCSASIFENKMHRFRLKYPTAAGAVFDQSGTKLRL